MSYLDRVPEPQLTKRTSAVSFNGVANTNGTNNHTHDTDSLTKRQTSNCDKFNSWMKKEMARIFTMETLKRRVPIVRWLPLYTWSTFVCDLLAGLTVGLTAIPQGIAYATVAGLDAEYGLYSGFMGCFVYTVLGSTKDITIGPTAILALMTQKSVDKTHNADFAVLLCFLTGCLIFLFGLLHLGVVVDFISVPVTVGFTTAAAITIACSQLKSLLGIKGKSNEFLETWITLIEHIKETRYQDVVLGVSTIIVLVFLKKLNEVLKKKFSGQTVSKCTKVVLEVIRILALARNAIVVVVGIGIAYAFHQNGQEPFQLTGKIGGGLPPFEPPPFSTIDSSNNQTMNFIDMTGELGTAIIAIPLIAILESIAIAKAFAKGRVLDATQEMFALGMSNILGSFVRSMPVTGSFTRSAVNNASGVRTPLGGIFTGALVLLALGLLTSTFYYIPKATLAGVIISAMFSMIEYEEIAIIWRTKKLDIVPLLATILGCLFLGLDYGILLGVGVNVIFIFYQAARPKVTTEDITVSEVSVLLVRPEQNLIFPSAEYFRDAIMNSCLEKEKDVLIILDGRNLHSLDSTVAKNLKILTDDLKLREQDIIFWNWPASAISICLGFNKELGKYFYSGSNIETIIQERNNSSSVVISVSNGQSTSKELQGVVEELLKQQEPLLDRRRSSDSYKAISAQPGDDDNNYIQR